MTISVTGVDRADLYPLYLNFRYSSSSTPRLDFIPRGGGPGRTLYFQGFLVSSPRFVVSRIAPFGFACDDMCSCAICVVMLFRTPCRSNTRLQLRTWSSSTCALAALAATWTMS
jgi:hypothetical protein